jgi:branched-chain amino acid transport system ATP-binding protein
MASAHLGLIAQDISVQFEGLKALSGVSLTVPRGRISGLIGPNGAGKTTLINVLTGFQPADHGTIALEGETIEGIAAHRLRRKGVARTFQSGRLFRDLTVVDNLEVTGVGLGLSRRDALAEAERTMEWLGIAQLAGAIAGTLPYTDERRVAIGRAIMCKPRYLLLDEPAAGMNPSEVNELSRLIQRIRDRGITILVVEHHVRLIMVIADTVTVLSAGCVIANGPPNMIQRDPAVVAAYLGQRDEPALHP